MKPPAKSIFFALLLFLLFGFSPALSFADDGKGKTPFYEDLLTIKELQFSADKWIGFGGAVGFRGLQAFKGVDTVFWFTLGMAVKKWGYFYYPDGTVYSGGDAFIDPDHDPFFDVFNFHYSFGVSQGLIYFPEERRNLLEAFLYCRFYNDIYIQDSRYDQLVFRSGLPDSRGIFFTRLVGGLSLDGTRVMKTSRVKKGVEAELTVSWAPDYFLNSQFGKASYVGFHGDFRGFLPYFQKVSDKGMNLLSLYQGWWFHAEYVFGDYVPIAVREQASGRYWATAMGGGVRGVDPGRYDAPFKIIASTELRLNLPSMGFRSFITGLIVYFDSGYYNYFDGKRGGILFSTGGGAFVDLFGIAKLAVYSEYFINGVKVNGKHFTPLSFSLGLQF